MKKYLAFFLLTLLLGAACASPLSAEPPPQPVYIVLYSRFYDHSHHSTNLERLRTLLSLLDRTREKHPESHMTALLQFSGTVSELLWEQNAEDHMLDRLKDYAAKGIIDIGYTGEEEPSYINRPKPQVHLENTGDARWSALGEAASRFLTDYKNPVTGDPFPGLSGGLKRMQEVFGPAAFVSGITELIGGDAAVTHQLRRLNPTAVMTGFPGPDQRHNIEGYSRAVETLAKLLSAPVQASPEAFWEDGMLRLSETSLSDYRPRSTDMKVEELKTVLSRTDRTRPRLIRLEVASYSRYLKKQPDGTAKWDPMEWLYFHPNDPTMPVGLKAFEDPSIVTEGYKKEEAVIESLITQFFSTNPGSGFLSVRELADMAKDPEGTTVSRAQVQAIAADVNTYYSGLPLNPPPFVKAGARFFSDAEAVLVLVQALSHPGQDPVQLRHTYGPLSTGVNGNADTGTVTVADIVKAAGRLSPVIANDTWKDVPDNRVPTLVEVGALKVNPAQFLNIMARAYLDLTPERQISLSPMQGDTMLTRQMAKNSEATDQGSSWTFKPAPLRLPPSGALAQK